MVLLVDDDLTFSEAAIKALSGEYFVLEAATGVQAIDFLKAIDFSVALVDLDLPGASGFELIQSIHQDRPELPIVAISGVYSRAALESAKELGATAVLEKPVTPEWSNLILQLSGHIDPQRRRFFGSNDQ